MSKKVLRCSAMQGSIINGQTELLIYREFGYLLRWATRWTEALEQAAKDPIAFENKQLQTTLKHAYVHRLRPLQLIVLSYTVCSLIPRPVEVEDFVHKWEHLVTS